MKTIQKILLGALLIGIGCLASVKMVKADGALTYDYSTGLTINITEPASAGKLLTVYDDGDNPLFNKTLDSEGTATATIAPDQVLAQFSPATQTTYTLTAKIEGTAKGSVDVPVYVGTASVDDATKVTLISPTTPVRSLNPNTTFTVAAKAVQAPNYVKKVGGTEVNVTDYSGSTFKVEDGNVAIESGDDAAATITLNQTTSSPITATISWNPETISYPYAYLNLEDTTGTGIEHSITMGSFVSPFTSAQITFTGHGTAKLTMKASMTSGEASAVECGTKTFGFAETIRKVAITSGKGTIIKNANEPYEAKVYLDDAGSVLASDQDVIWSVTPATATVTPTTATHEGVTLKATSTGTYTLIAKSASNLTVLDQKTITVEDPTEHVLSVTIDPSCPNEIAIKSSGTYKATVTLTDGSPSKYGVNWSVDNTALATITTKGVLTAKNTAGVVKVKATSVSDPAVFDEYTVTIVTKVALTDLNYKSAEGGTIKLTKKYDSSSDFSLDLGWNKGVTGTPANASVSSITYAVTSGDTSTVSISGSTISAKTAEKTVTVTPTIKYTDNSVDPNNYPVDIQVIKDWTTKLTEGGSSNSSSTSSDYYIGFTLDNNEVYTGVEPSKNLKSITGYRVDVMYDGDSKEGRTFEKSMSVGSNYKVEKSDLNDLLKDASDKLSGDSPKVTFRISPYGTNQAGNKVYVTEAAKTIERTVYKDNGRYYLDKNGSNSNSSSLNSSSSKASGSGAGSGNAGAGLDKVPKTGEGNARMLIIMIAMISATIAGAILLSYMPARANANKGIAGAEDVKGFFDSTPTTNAKDTNTEQTAANTADKEDDKS